MNIVITIDDSGNPIFSQEGTIDMDSFIKSILSDNAEIKKAFFDKFKALAQSIKIDNKAISEKVEKSVSELFTFPSSYKNEVKKQFNDKIKNLLSSVKIDEKQINKNVNSLFEYKDKDKQLKSVFDKINTTVSDSISLTQKENKKEESKNKENNKTKENLFTLKSERKNLTETADTKEKVKFNIETKETASKNKKSTLLKSVDDMSAKRKMDIIDKIQKVRIEEIQSNVFKPIILDSNIMDIDSGVLGIISNALSEDISQKNYDKLSPLFTNMSQKQVINKLTNSEDTVFEDDATPVILKDIDGGLMTKLALLFGLPEGDEKKRRRKESDDSDESNGIVDMLLDFFGLKKVVKVAGGMMSLLASALKLAPQALKFATNPVTMLVAGLIWAVVDGIKGFFMSDEWGVSKISGVIGGVLGGTSSGVKGAFNGAGKWALFGATIGTPFGLIGIAVGGLIGAVIGAIVGWIGGEKISKGLDAIGNWFSDKWESMTSGIKNFYPAFKKWMANLIPTFVKELIGMNDKGDISASQSLVVKDFKEGGLVGGILVLGARLSEGYRKLVAAVTPKFIKDLIGMDDKGFVYPSKGGLVAIFEEKGFFGGILELGKIFGEKMRKFVARLTPQFVKDFIGMDENGIIDITGESGIFAALGAASAGDTTKLKDLSAKTLDGLHKWIWSLMSKIPFIDYVLEYKDGRVIFKGSEALTNAISTTKEKMGEAWEKTTQMAADTKSWFSDKWSSLKEKTSETWEGAKEKGSEVLFGEKGLESSVEKASQIYYGKDVAVDYENPNTVQIQLDENDKMYNFKTGAAFAKSGGALDQAIKSVADKIDEQIKKADILNEMFEFYLKAFSQYNNNMMETLPKLASSGKQEAHFPAESSIPDGYIRDPVYEYRMKRREGIYI